MHLVRLGAEPVGWIEHLSVLVDVVVRLEHYDRGRDYLQVGQVVLLVVIGG